MVSPLKILHPSQTRWLSLESTVKRLISQYNALSLYFIDQSSQNISQANTILHLLQQPSTKLYLEFLSYSLPFFNKLNILMQSERPKIYIIYNEVITVIKTIMDCFIKEDILNKNNVYDIEYKNPRNFLELDKMYFGAAINLSDQDSTILQPVKLKCLEFYIESINQILSRFPLKNSVLKKLEFLNPDNVMNRKIASISDIFVHFPNLIEDIQEVDSEWRELRNFDFADFKTQNDSDVEIFWGKVSKIKLGNGDSKFPKLATLVFNLLCLPHSSANVERIFSQVNLNKTKIRNKLNSKTLEGLLFTKSLIANSGGDCFKFQVTQNLVKKCNNKMYLSSSPVESDTDSD